MDPKRNKGMWLRHGGQPQKKNAGWILHMGASLLTCVVLILAAVELTGFDGIYTPSVMVLAGGALCIAYGVLEKLGRQKWCYPWVLGLLLAFVLLCGKQILEGICLAWNQLGDTWTAGTGWVLPELKTNFPAEESGSCLLLFSVFAGALSGMLCCLLVSKGSAILAVLMPGLLLAGKIGFHQEMTAGYLLLVLAAAVFLLISSGWGRKKAAVPVLLSWGVFAVLACLLVSIAVIPGVESWAQDFSRQLHGTVHERTYETKYTTLPEGDLSRTLTSEEEAKPALIVTMQKPEEMYLRGFVGVNLENSTWSALDPQALAENEDLLYWLNLHAFTPGSQFEQAAGQLEWTENTVTVQNMGACSRYLYVPFSLCQGTSQQAENLNGDSILSDGSRIYVFSAVSNGAERIAQVLEYLQTSEENAVLEYRRAESAYREFVYSYYLQIPEDVAALLEPEWESIGDQYGSLDSLTSQQAQACVRLFLERWDNEDIKLSLAGAEGTSFQRATAAVMTLRYFGIPARYAEGYIITAEMAEEAEAGSSIEVDSSCAGAWAEVYQDGIGWIPMDLTPGMEELSGKDPDQQNGEEDPLDSSKIQEGQELEETPEEKDKTQEPDGGYQVSVVNAVKRGLLSAVPLLLAMALLLWGRRRILLKRREEKFQAEDRSDAVAWIFADTALLLEKLGFDRGNGSMRELYGPIREKFGEDYAGEYADMVGLNDRAMFSSHELEESQREKARGFHDKTAENLRSASKWHTRLWMKWVLCLY